MKVIIVGLGVQGYKRRAHARSDFVASVDPKNSEAEYRDLRDVPRHLLGTDQQAFDLDVVDFRVVRPGRKLDAVTRAPHEFGGRLLQAAGGNAQFKNLVRHDCRESARVTSYRLGRGRRHVLRRLLPNVHRTTACGRNSFCILRDRRLRRSDGL